MKFLLLMLPFLLSTQAFAEETPYEKTPLIIAIENNDLEGAESLLKSGVDVNDMATWFYTPLEIAIHNKNVLMVDLFLRYGANSNLISSNSRSPMDWAIQMQSMPIMKLLLKHNANINALSDNQSYLRLAFESLRDFGDQKQLAFQKEAYFLIYENGFDLEKSGDTYANVITAAAKSGDRALMEDLFSRGDFKSKVNEYNYVEETALMMAIGSLRNETEVLDIVQFLLSQGADPNLKTYNISPLRYAQKMNRQTIVQALINAGAKP